jgi:hypothetical protein
LLKQDVKINKQQEIAERIKATKDGIIVLDSGEKWHSLTRTFRTMSSEETDTLMKYLYNFKGINQAVIDGTAGESQMQVFFNKTIMPIVLCLVEELNYKFLTQTARTQGQKIEYFKNPFEYMSMPDMLRYLYLGATFFTQNEVRRMGFRLHPLPGGDELLNNKNFEKGISGIKKRSYGEVTNAMIANTIEYGKLNKSGRNQPGKPFLSTAARSTKKVREEAMQKSFDRAVEDL